MWYNVPQNNDKEMNIVGKFSKPRKNFVSSEETVILPKVPAVSEEPAQPAEIPETEPQDAFDSFDTEFAEPKRNRKKVVLISLCSVAAVLLIGVIASIWFLFGRDPNNNLILNNVYAAGVNLGGMTREEAEAALHRATDLTFSQNDMVIELPDLILSLSPSDTKASLDVEALVEAAYEYGRTGTRAEQAEALKNSMVMDHPIALLPYLNLDLNYIRKELDDYGASFNTVYADASAVVEGQMPVLDAADEKFNPEAEGQTLLLNMGMPGRYVDIDSIYNKVLDAYSFNIFLVQISMQERERIPDALDLQALYDEYYVAPVDASIDTETFDVIPEVYGYGFDLDAAKEALENARYGDTVEIPLELIAPERLGDDMSAVLFRDVLCEYKTEHTKNENRNTNLRLACEAINGTILYPGDTFDYNTVVGKRTEEKGYKKAAAYSSGKTVETLGGGICQVSSTIYYCCLVADLEIVNRLPHSYVSSYMPMGMDATVSWGGPEFTFRNNTNYPIRIETWVEGGYVHCKLLGTDEKDYYIVMEYEVVGSVGADTVYEEFTKDNNPEGYRDGEVIQTAYRGYTVKTYKCKYDKKTDELIERVFDQTSVYKKRDKIIAKLVEETEPPTEPPKPTDPPETEPPKPTDPPATEPPKPTDPPATDPPATNPPPTDPPATNPPPTDPPATNPPPADPPAESSENN